MGIVILVKGGETYNILKSPSHCLLVERWDETGWSIFFIGDMPIYYVPLLIRSRLHLVRDTAAKKEVDMTI